MDAHLMPFGFQNILFWVGSYDFFWKINEENLYYFGISEAQNEEFNGGIK